jgi:hypothetical protein
MRKVPHALDLKLEKDRFELRRVGDHLMSHCQYDLSHVWNVQGWNPGPACSKDDTILLCIWRTNWDALWSRKMTMEY